MDAHNRVTDSRFQLLLTSLLLSFLLAAPTVVQSQPPGAPQTPTKSASTSTSTQKKSRTVEGTLFFAVNKYPDGITIDPIVLLNKGQYIDPLPDDEALQKQIAAKYLRSGQKYRVIFGGAEAGTVTVGESHEFGLTHGATLQSSIKLSDEVKALATTSDTLGAKQNSRRVPTQEERAVMLNLMTEAYRKRQVPAAVIPKVHVNNITAIDLDADGTAELIGSFDTREQNDVSRALFLIAEMRNGQYQSGLIWFKKGVEATNEARRLIDVLDLDGDGIAEVFARTSYYESTDFTIYKKVKGVWRSVYQGGLFGV